MLYSTHLNVTPAFWTHHRFIEAKPLLPTIAWLGGSALLALFGTILLTIAILTLPHVGILVGGIVIGIALLTLASFAFAKGSIHLKKPNPLAYLLRQINPNWQTLPSLEAQWEDPAMTKEMMTLRDSIRSIRRRKRVIGVVIHYMEKQGDTRISRNNKDVFIPAHLLHRFVALSIVPVPTYAGCTPEGYSFLFTSKVDQKTYEDLRFVTIRLHERSRLRNAPSA